MALLRLAHALVSGLDRRHCVYKRCVGGAEAATLRVLEEAVSTTVVLWVWDTVSSID